MHSWRVLGIASGAEVIATTSLKTCANFTRRLPSALVVAGYGTALYCLSLSLRSIPVGVGYAVWSGIGIVLISLSGWALFGQKLDGPAVFGMALIIAGVLVLNLFSSTNHV